jgi:hypothetical protein
VLGPKRSGPLLITQSLHLGHLAHVHAYMGDDQTIHFKAIY